MFLSWPGSCQMRNGGGRARGAETWIRGEGVALELHKWRICETYLSQCSCSALVPRLLIVLDYPVLRVDALRDARSHHVIQSSASISFTVFGSKSMYHVCVHVCSMPLTAPSAPLTLPRRRVTCPQHPPYNDLIPPSPFSIASHGPPSPSRPA